MTKKYLQNSLPRLFMMIVFTSLLLNCDPNGGTKDIAVYFYSDINELKKTFIFSVKDIGASVSYNPPIGDKIKRVSVVLNDTALSKAISVDLSVDLTNKTQKYINLSENGQGATLRSATETIESISIGVINSNLD